MNVALFCIQVGGELVVRVIHGCQSILHMHVHDCVEMELLLVFIFFDPLSLKIIKVHYEICELKIKSAFLRILLLITIQKHDI